MGARGSRVWGPCDGRGKGALGGGGESGESGAGGALSHLIGAWGHGAIGNVHGG